MIKRQYITLTLSAVKVKAVDGYRPTLYIQWTWNDHPSHWKGCI